MCMENDKMLWETIQSPFEREMREKLLTNIQARQGLGATKLPQNMPITSPIPTSAYQAMNIPMSYFLGMPYTQRGFGTAGAYGLPTAAPPHSGPPARMTATSQASAQAAPGISAQAAPAPAPPDVGALAAPMSPWDIYRANIMGGRR